VIIESITGSLRAQIIIKKW